jgi:hypothetical protein
MENPTFNKKFGPTSEISVADYVRMSAFDRKYFMQIDKENYSKVFELYNNMYGDNTDSSSDDINLNPNV